MKIVLHAAFAVLIAVLLALPGSVSTIGAGPKPSALELSADFGNDPGYAIRSDMSGIPYISNNDTRGYPNNVQIQPNGTLYMRIQQNRRLVFSFADPIRRPGLDADKRLYCRGYNPTPLKSYNFTSGSLPSFLQEGASGEPANDFTDIRTAGVYTQVSNQNGTTWVYTTAFDLKSMGVTTPTTAYVALNMVFYLADRNGQFMVMSEYYLWRGQEPPTGIVKVTRDTTNKTWTIEPLPADDPVALDLATHLATEFTFNDGQTDPLPYPGFSDPHAPVPFQASLVFWVQSQAGKNGHPGGYCDLGDWRLPFRLTLTER